MVEIKLKENENTLYKEFGNDFLAIRGYFDALDKDESHYANSNDICTQLSLVKEMVDKVPKAFWKQKDIKILDCCCGNGNFPAYIGTKTSLNNLYFNEISEKRIENLIKYFGKDINLTKKDFLEFEDKEEYDMIVANPPYAKFTEDGARAAKNHNLSRLFIDKAIRCTKPEGYVLFIVPDNWMSFSDRNNLPSLLSEYQFRYISIHTPKKYFPNVGSTFTYFLVQKTKNVDSFTIANGYKINDTQEVKLPKGINFIPLYCSQLVLDILDKTVNNDNIPKYNIETSSDLHKHTKGECFSNIQDEEHKFKIWHTPRQCYWSLIPHKYQDGYKVFVSLTTQYETFIDNCGMTQSIAFIRCKDKDDAKRINEELNSPLYKFINNITRYGNFGNNRVLERLPVLSEVSLTEEELNFIETFNAAYYKSKKKTAAKEDNKNRTDVLIKDTAELQDEVNYSIYDYKDYFSYMCSVIPNVEQEKLEIDNMQPEFADKEGLIYIFVVDDKIFKIGQTTNTFADRIQSYNCGRKKARANGTCSVTNYFVLQSFLEIGKPVDVYAYVPPLAIYELFGKIIHSSEAPSKYAERLIVEDFEKKYYKKPIGCTQS